MKLKKLRLTFFLVLSFILLSLKAQKAQFHINTGFLLSQVDGDRYGGYHKIGYNFGAGFRFDSDKKSFWDWNTRINQKGYREVSDFFIDGIRLNYLENELVYGGHFDPKFDLGIGLYHGYLLNQIRTMRRSDVAPVFRITYRASEKINVGARFSWSIRSIREAQYAIWLNRALLFEISLDL